MSHASLTVPIPEAGSIDTTATEPFPSLEPTTLQLNDSQCDTYSRQHSTAQLLYICIQRLCMLREGSSLLRQQSLSVKLKLMAVSQGV